MATSGDAAYDVPNVKSVQVPERGSSVIAFLNEGAPEPPEVIVAQAISSPDEF